MGIRYYAYAFDKHQTEGALTHPQAFISSDPLADAWGLDPHARVSAMSGVQAVPERDMLYLDKAWRGLQEMTESSSTDVAPRPAYRMFEGKVTMHGAGWKPWVRALGPDEIRDIAEDLASLLGEIATCGQLDGNEDAEYLKSYLERACDFVSGLAVECRGMVYTIR